MAKSVDIPNLVERGGRWRYRRTVPADVRAKLPEPRREWVETFPPGAPLDRVLARVETLRAQHDSLIARARSGEVLSAEVIAEAERTAREMMGNLTRGDLYEFLAMMDGAGTLPRDRAVLNALENRGSYVAPGVTLTAAYERDRDQNGGQRSEAPFARAVDSFVATVGDRDLGEVTREDVRSWIGAEVGRGLSPSTVRRRLGALRAIVNRAITEHGHAGPNPFERHRETFRKLGRGSGAASSADRLPFNRAMLALLDEYLATSRRLGHETRNVARILRCTGAGPAEVGGLVLADVDLEGDIPSVWIRPNALRGLKTGAGVRERVVPLVGEALDAARDACRRARSVAGRRPPEAVPIFPGFGASGRGADALSAKLNRAIRAAGVPKSPRLTAYSWRHSVKEAMRSAGVADHVQRRVLGHAGSGSADRYGSPQARLSEARGALLAAMEWLGNVDERIFRKNERFLKAKEPVIRN
ncbi:MAG: tyrosine-type recombinase/integrase [Maricaulaceae bacterium]|jgi:integrase